MALNYTTYSSALSVLMAQPVTDPNFIKMLPNAIDYGEQRIYRELDMLVADVRDSDDSTVALNRA